MKKNYNAPLYYIAVYYPNFPEFLVSHIWVINNWKQPKRCHSVRRSVEKKGKMYSGLKIVKISTPIKGLSKGKNNVKLMSFIKILLTKVRVWLFISPVLYHDFE